MPLGVQGVSNTNLDGLTGGDHAATGDEAGGHAGLFHLLRWRLGGQRAREGERQRGHQNDDGQDIGTAHVHRDPREGTHAFNEVQIIIIPSERLEEEAPPGWPVRGQR